MSQSTTNAPAKKLKMVNRSATTKVVDPLTFDPSAVFFGDPIPGIIPGTPPIQTWRIQLGVNNELTDEDKAKNIPPTQGDLIFSCDRSFCFGFGEGRDNKTNAIIGYSAGIAMWDRDGATPRQLATTKLITAITELCKDHLTSDDTMSKVERFAKDGLERAELKKLEPLYWKKEKGKIIAGTGPTFYPKLAWKAPSKKKKKVKVEKEDGTTAMEEMEVEIPSRFFTDLYKEGEFDEKGNPVPQDPLELLEKFFYITPLIKVESIFIGAKITLQCKIYEADCFVSQQSRKKLLHNEPIKNPSLLIGGKNPLLAPSTAPSSKESSGSDDGAQKPAELDNGKEEKKEEKKKIIRKKAIAE